MTPKKKAELLRLCEKATPGEWRQETRQEDWRDPPRNVGLPRVNAWHGHTFGGFVCQTNTGREMEVGNSLANAAFIAAARSAIPDLLAENERLTNSLAQANKDFAAVFAKLVVSDGREAEKHELTAAQRTLINHARQAFEQPQVEEQTKQIDLAAFDRMKAENERLRDALTETAVGLDAALSMVERPHFIPDWDWLRGIRRRAREALAETPAEKPDAQA